MADLTEAEFTKARDNSSRLANLTTSIPSVSGQIISWSNSAPELYSTSHTDDKASVLVLAQLFVDTQQVEIDKVTALINSAGG